MDMRELEPGLGAAEGIVFFCDLELKMFAGVNRAHWTSCRGANLPNGG